MSHSVLVTWATRYGSTEETAQAIATALRESGLTVEARSVESVESLEGYEAVVLGCALYMSRIHRHARQFLLRHREALSRLPVALFVLGPIHRDEKEREGARAQLDKELRKLPWFRPVAQEIFGGRWDPARMGFPFSWLPGVRRIAAMDARDPEAIVAWAEKVGALPRPAAMRN